MKVRYALLAVLQIVLLGCLAYCAFTIRSLEKNRIPPAVFNMVLRNKGTVVPVGFRYMTVKIHGKNGVGSGVAVSKHIIVTNSHVVAGQKIGGSLWVDVFKANGHYKQLVATIVTIDEARDIALVGLTSHAFSEHAVLASKDPKWADNVVMVGCPLSFSPMATEGRYAYRYGSKILIACNGLWGNSGGPIFNARGELIAIAHKMVSPNQAAGAPTYLHICVPYDWIRDHISENATRLK